MPVGQGAECAILASSPEGTSHPAHAGCCETFCPVKMDQARSGRYRPDHVL